VIIHENGSVTFIPAENWSGIETITFYATDNLTGPISKDVTITVVPINDPPIITVTSPVNNSHHFTSDSIYFNITVHDIDNDTFTYLWDFNDETTSTLKNVTHQFSEAGIYNVSITVNDGLDSERKWAAVVVEPVTADDEETKSDLPLIWFLSPIIIVIILLLFLSWWRFKAKKES
jgi:PKD repeat protein